MRGLMHPALAGLLILAKPCVVRAAEGAAPQETAPIAAAIDALPETVRSEPVVFDALVRFYKGCDYRLAWDGGRSVPAQQFLAAAAGASAWGLSPKDYAPDPPTAKKEAAPMPEAGPTLSELARRDLAFSLGFLRLARDLRCGRSPPQPDPPGMQWQPAIPDLVPELEAAVADAGIPARLAALEPAWEGYAALKKALGHYRAIAAGGGWPAVPSIGRSMRIGTKSAAIAVLRRRLAADGDLSPRAAPKEGEKTLPWQETFDGILDTAVRQFQARHGLDVDGIVGPKTLGALNQPVGELILQLRLNLERWRWVERTPPDRGLVVMLPLRELAAIEKGRTVLRMRIVHGPAVPELTGESFSDKLEYLEFAPQWSVPYHIATADLLPKARKDPAAFQSEGFEIVSDYNPESARHEPVEETLAQVQEGKLFIRQRPGPTNPLGQVKFMVPNYFAIFLHGREKDPNFKDTGRDIGRGWIRVQEPAPLAAFVLARESGWSPDHVRKAMASTQPQRVPLEHPISFHAFYRTAAFDAQGQLLLWPDTDGRDARLAKATGFSARDP